MELDKIINKKYNTDRGYLYFVDLIKQKYPFLHINEENLKTLRIEPMNLDYFYRTGFAGEYVADRNVIKIFTNLDEYGNRIFNVDFLEDELIDTFVHELIHCLTSKIVWEQDLIYEGINMRTISDKEPSYFLGISEGITQMLTNELLGLNISNAYPFETTIAKQLSKLLGKEELIKVYSKNDYETFANMISKCFNNDFNFAKCFIIKTFYFHLLCSGRFVEKCEIVGLEVQDCLITMAKNTNKITEIQDLILDKDKTLEYIKYLPFEGESLAAYGFKELGESRK